MSWTRLLAERYCADFRGQQKDAAAVPEDAARDHAPKTQGSDEDVPKVVVFVNTRRGKGNRTKRKISDTGPVTECDSKVSRDITHHHTPHHIALWVRLTHVVVVDTAPVNKVINLKAS